MKGIHMGMMTTGLLYHINRENGKEYKATVILRSLIKTVLQEMHNHFGHLGIGKTYSPIKRYYYWPKNDKTHAGPCRQLLLMLKGEVSTANNQDTRKSFC